MYWLKGTDEQNIITALQRASRISAFENVWKVDFTDQRIYISGGKIILDDTKQTGSSRRVSLTQSMLGPVRQPFPHDKFESMILSRHTGTGQRKLRIAISH